MQYLVRFFPGSAETVGEVEN